MGYYWFGLPEYLPTWAKEVLGPDTALVETGTFFGDSALAASRHFASVDTIELQPALHSAASERLADTHVRCHLGDSRDVLAQIVPEIPTGVLVWLDAHYSGGATAGVDDRCPLFGELDILLGQRDAESTAIVIDDIRLFVGLDGYPRLDQIAHQITQAGWAWSVIDDVLVASSADNVEALQRTSASWRQPRGIPGGLWFGARTLVTGTRKRVVSNVRSRRVLK